MACSGPGDKVSFLPLMQIFQLP